MHTNTHLLHMSIYLCTFFSLCLSHTVHTSCSLIYIHFYLTCNIVHNSNNNNNNNNLFKVHMLSGVGPGTRFHADSLENLAFCKGLCVCLMSILRVLGAAPSHSRSGLAHASVFPLLARSPRSLARVHTHTHTHSCLRAFPFSPSPSPSPVPASRLGRISRRLSDFIFNPPSGIFGFYFKVSAF